MKSISKDSSIMRIIAIIIALVIFSLTSVGGIYAAADEGGIEYSDVLEDLQKDETFDETKYPENAKDYSLQLIQIAESEDDELFIYVYQPSGKTKDFRAFSINISRSTGDDINYFNYKLKYLNSNGVFYKYLVKNFAVQDSDVRYYSITSIYRPFDEDVDDQADYDNTITEVPFKVAKEYGFKYTENGLQIEVVDIETIEVTDKFVGYVDYPNGFSLNYSRCHSHFVAFDTDMPMDKLLEADVYYTWQSYYVTEIPFQQPRVDWGEVTDQYAYLTYTDKVTHSGNSLFSYTFTWDRIETINQFITEVNSASVSLYSGVILNVSLGSKITDEAMEALMGKQWVLRFAETDYLLYSYDGINTRSQTLVGDVTILRLKFETDGITYNLGVIDNKQTGSDKPINNWSPTIGPSFLVYGISIIFALIVVYIIYRIGLNFAEDKKSEQIKIKQIEKPKGDNKNGR